MGGVFRFLAAVAVCVAVPLISTAGLYLLWRGGGESASSTNSENPAENQAAKPESEGPPALTPAPAPAPAPKGEGTTLAVATEAPPVQVQVAAAPTSGVGSERIAALEKRIEFLERRSKMTRLADEAISSGSRFAFKQLEEEFENPGMVGLKVAANSEIIRVESVYARAAGMQYRPIPVSMIDPALKADTDLSVDQLGDIIISSSVPPEARARAVQILAMRPSYETCIRILDCVRTEPNLAVLIEATTVFKKMSGYQSPRIFAGSDAEAWFEANQERIKRSYDEMELERAVKGKE